MVQGAGAQHRQNDAMEVAETRHVVIQQLLARKVQPETILRDNFETTGSLIILTQSAQVTDDPRDLGVGGARSIENRGV